MNSVKSFEIWQFLLIYLLLLVVVFIMKKHKINQTKLLIVASLKMTVQLVLVGFILTYIFKNPHPVFTIIYILLMISFANYRVISKNKWLNRKFKLTVILSITIPGLAVVAYFIGLVVGESVLNPQYVIPISGMIMGNTMTGVGLGLKTFEESISAQRTKINALTCIGSSPKTILLPFIKQSLETAILPTINSMLGMGIVALPGMMTGQILAGTVPLTAILYQIAIMIAICTAVTCSVFFSLYFGSRTLYDRKNEVINI